jgi:undecaprenyl-diphosphatase
MRIADLDARADDALEPLRDSRAGRVVFGLASTVGDFSLVWHVTGFSLSLLGRIRLAEAIVLSIALGAESLVVNQGIKRLFRRQRPTVSGDGRFALRTPSTTSFPSGHASSAVFAVVLLGSFTGLPLALAWTAMAAVVAASRVVVRIHHLSDVLGGLATGLVLGMVALPVAASVLG